MMPGWRAAPLQGKEVRDQLLCDGVAFNVHTCMSAAQRRCRTLGQGTRLG